MVDIETVEEVRRGALFDNMRASTESWYVLVCAQLSGKYYSFVPQGLM